MDSKTFLHDSHAAALWQAIALRRLHHYRSARENAKQHGDELHTLLIDPPSYEQISDAYAALIEEHIDNSIDSTTAARAVVDLLAAIALRTRCSATSSNVRPL